MYDIRSRCRNSIGSSMVMMLRVVVRLMASIIAASVVDLPDPVRPVTSTRPRGENARSRTTGGVVTQLLSEEQQLRDHVAQVLGGGRRLVEREQLSVDAQDGGGTDLDVQIAGVGRDHLVETGAQVHGRSLVQTGSSRNSFWPNSTGWEFSTRILTTRPWISLSISFISFIASTMQMVWPTSTTVPTSTYGSASGAGAR